MRNFVIARTPRNKAFLSLGFLGILAIAGTFGVYLGVCDLRLFGSADQVTISSFAVKSLGCSFLVFLFAAFFVASLRNNPKSQNTEFFLLVSGSVLLIIFAVFSEPLLYVWAYLHHYHFDHYEATHRGGWYIFRLNGT